MKTVKVTIEGLDGLVDKFNKLPAVAQTTVEQALKKAALDLQGKAQLLAPVDTGDLRGSAFTEVNKLEAVTGFMEPYALYQHENTELHHPKGGQAKYLEQPYEENRDRYIDDISKAVKGAVEK